MGSEIGFPIYIKESDNVAIYRNIQMSFWQDSKVVDDFTPEDKYFYLYLMTNPHTNLAGCYEISYKQMADETGYNKDTIERLLTRFSEVHNVIRYSKQTKEVWIINWSKHNWTKSEKFRKPLEKEIQQIKDSYFRESLLELFLEKDTVSIPYRYPIDTTVTVTDTVLNNNKDIINNIIIYLNNILNTNYKSNTKNTVKHINARIEEGFCLEDFKRVIDYKVSQWKDDPKMKDYLRPETLFGTKFESYLNSAPKKKEIKPNENLSSIGLEVEEEMSDEEWLKMMENNDL